MTARGASVEAGRSPGPARRSGGPWGHVLVSVSACILTVSIVGSATFLAYRIYGRRALQEKVRTFVGALENRGPEELEDRVQQLKSRPKLAEFVLPELCHALKRSRSERQLCAVIRLCEGFLDRHDVEESLFELRGDPRPQVSGAAVAALAKLEPRERAAERLGKCLDGAASGEVGAAGVDAACAGLYELGSVGMAEAEKRLAALTPQRRVWLVGYVDQRGGPHRTAWLTVLERDGDEVVSRAARQAMRPASQLGASSAAADPSRGGA